MRAGGSGGDAAGPAVATRVGPSVAGALPPVVRAGPAGRALIIAALALAAALPLLSAGLLPGVDDAGVALWAPAGAWLLVALAWACPSAPAKQVTVFVALVTVTLPARDLWPVPLLVALGLYAAAVAVVPALRGTPSWLRAGVLDAPSHRLLVWTVAGSAVGLVGWYRLAGPDLDPYAQALALIPMWAVPAAGLLWAVLNAAAEEIAFRGILLDALRSAVGPVGAVLGQATAFALLHVGDLPGGPDGVALCLAYGVALGVLRVRSGGLLWPWLAHVVADLVILGLLVKQVL